ncbi:hypothetical protein XaC1_99 [Xanthomonas phage XaC1]|nr:hypothetical protein XaC1_99 [Xanthomonas phage XaC1]
MSKDNDKIDLFAEINEIYKKRVQDKEVTLPAPENAFIFEDDEVPEQEEDVQRTVTVIAESKRKMNSNTPVRSQEEYEEHILSTHFETMTKEDGSTYEVKVTVLKPGINPLENMKPAYCYATSS